MAAGKLASKRIDATSRDQQSQLDFRNRSRDDLGMDIPGRVLNGVVVLDGSMSLPEGAAVFVSFRATPVIRFAKNPKPVVLPLFDAEESGVIHLTNDRITEILDQEDVPS